LYCALTMKEKKGGSFSIPRKNASEGLFSGRGGRKGTKGAADAERGKRRGKEYISEKRIGREGP